MLRVEAAIFASAKPVPREALVRVVGENCRFDDLIADLIHELRGSPYDLVQVAGGYALRTKTRFAPAAYVTTKTFLQAFGLASLRDLPNLERLKTEGLLRGKDGGEADLDSALGLAEQGDEDRDVFLEGE